MAEEETTFNGVVTFPYDKVKSKRLINLDNDRDNTVLVGADGDICNEYFFEGELIKNDSPSYKVAIDGFPGGNSGMNIKLSENNAISTMAKRLKDKDIFIKSINGGISENDLAEFCEVVINTNLNVEEIFKDLNAKIDRVSNKLCFSKNNTENIINEILDLKCGYVKENLVSANLGTIITDENKIKIYYVIRSIMEKELEKTNKASKDLNHNKEVYFNEYKTYPKEEIGHGGIECSAIKKRIDKLDIISIGSNLENIHSVKETAYISSWLKIYNLLIKFIESL